MARVAQYFYPPWNSSMNDPSLDFVRYDLMTCDDDDICIVYCSNSSDNVTGNSPQIFESYHSLFTCIMFPNISRNLDQGLYSASDVQHLTDNGFYVNDSHLSQTIVLLDYCSDTPSCTPHTTPCTRANLVLDNSVLSAQGFVDCYASLCSPPLANPDIAGIGTVVAYLSQVALALLAFWSLQYIVGTRSFLHDQALRAEHGVVSPVQLRAIRYRWRKHEQAIIGALVEFHKAQCFFAIAIQIAALDFINSTSDATFPLRISSIGYGPVAFVLWNLSRYEKVSWYLCILSLFSWLLSNWKTFRFPGFTPQVGQSTASHSCGLAVSPSAACTVFVDYVRDATYEASLERPLTYYLCWPFCSIHILWIVLYELGSSQPRAFAKIQKFFCRNMRLFIPILICLWAVTFVINIIGWATYFWEGYIETSTLGFGQIVAITVWLPALAEFLWLEMNGMIKGSEYRLAKPLKVVSGDAEEDSSAEARDNCDNDENGRALPDLPTRLGDELAAPANRSSMDDQGANSPGSATGLTVQHIPETVEVSKGGPIKRRTTF